MDVTYLNWSYTQFACGWIGHVECMWQLHLATFDNFLRFSIHRLDYSTLFMSTTMCSSACRRYEPLIVALILSYFAVFSYYIYWLIYSGSHLHILVSFYPSLLVCMPSAYFLFRFCSGLFYFTFACAPSSDFFRGFLVAFQAFFIGVF